MKILYVVNNAAFFCSHRLPIALAARAAGHEVALLTGQAGSAELEARALDELRGHGIPHRTVAFGSAVGSPLRELRGFVQTLLAMADLRPDLVHCASPKGVLYGGLASRLSGVPALVLSISGMGSMFVDGGSRLKRALRRAYLLAMRRVLRHRRLGVIVQNEDDRRLVLRAGVRRDHDVILIPGSGVDLSRFAAPRDAPRAELVVLPARLIRDKGVVEFVEAARRLRGRGCTWRFALVGTADYDNPSNIGEARVREWVREGHVEWWGHREDMAEVFAMARIACLPSYREGMPKALLEAAAAGCAVVTTDAPGCREAVEPGVTGDLVPVRDAAALAEALERLIAEPARLQSYGEAGRRRAFARFDLQEVTRRTLDLYQQLHGGTPAPALAADTAH